MSEDILSQNNNDEKILTLDERLEQTREFLLSLPFDELILYKEVFDQVYKESIDSQANEIINKFLEEAKKYNITLSVEGGQKVKNLSKSSTKKVKGEPQYRNPDDRLKTWTGHGRKPDWLVKLLAEGKNLEDFKI